MEAFIEILNQLDAMTILAMFGIGYFFYTKVTNAFNERINQSENNLKELVNKSENNLKELVNSLNERINQSEKHLKEYIDAKMEPIQEQVYNHIPTQMKAMEDKFDRKFETMEDKFDRKFDTLYGLIVNKDEEKGKEMKKEHTTKDKEKPA